MSKDFSLIGRDRDLAAIDAWLATDDPVMTLKGPGGGGKTTLAREFARREGWAWVELEPCRSADDIRSAMARALGAWCFSPAAPALAEALQQVDGVVLDNAEHALAAVREVVEPLAHVCRILVTSRERLGLKNEYVWELTELSVEDARQLFMRRARAVSPLFRDHPATAAEVDRLVARIDRLPLALELAAFRTQVLKTDQIVERLEARFDILENRYESKTRHVSMDASIEWSWELLDEAERDILAQCAVFRSSFTFELAEEVVVSDRWSGEAIQSMVERSLLRMEPGEPPRFQLYSGVRRFVERRQGPDEAAVLRLLERLNADPDKADPWNVLHAFDLGLKVAPEQAALLCVRTQPMLVGAGFVWQLPALLERAAQAPIPDSLKARVYVSRASVAETYGDGDTEKWLKRAESLAGDDQEGSLVRVHVSLQRAHRADREGKADLAEQHYAEVEVALRELTDPPAVVQIQLAVGRGFNALGRGDVARALELFESAKTTAEHAEDATWTARCMSWVGRAELADGRRTAATKTLRNALQLFDTTGEVVARALAEQALAFALLDEDPEAACAAARQAETSAAAAQWPQLRAALAAFLARVEDVDDAPEQIRQQLAYVRLSRDHHDFCGVWLGLVVALIRAGDLDEAERELASLTSEVDEPRASEWLRRYEVVLSALRRKPGAPDDDFATAVAKLAGGGTVDLEPFDDPAVRFVFDYCPEPLRLLAGQLELQARARELGVFDDGCRIVLPSRQEVDLTNSHLLRRLFLRICEAAEASTSVSSDELIETGWPDEKMSYDSALRRIYSAISNLRKHGLEDIIVTTEEGYSLAPDLKIHRES